MGEREADPVDDYSSVLHALRIPGDEVQFGAVLAAICAEPGAARVLAGAVIAHASCGNANARALIGRVPANVQLRREERLAEVAVGRRSLRGRARRGGRTDRDILGQGWRFIIELKINAGINPAQVDRYLQEAPTAILARVVEETEDLARWQRQEHWVGIAKWRDVIADLYNLPAREPARSEWVRLLRVLERDRDFDERRIRVSAETDAAADILSGVSEPLLRHVRRELIQFYGNRAVSFAGALRAFTVSRRDPWASIAFGVTSTNWIFDLSLRDVFKRAPVLQLDRQMFRHVDTGRRRRNQEHRIAQALATTGQPVIRAPMDSALRHPNGVLEWASEQLTRLVEDGAFDPDIELFARGKR